MGELHLEIIIDRMKREFGVEANVGAPQVAYREALRKSVEQEGKFIRQSGGRGQYGHVKLRLEPQPPGTGYEFVDAIKGAGCRRSSYRGEKGRRGGVAGRRARRLSRGGCQGHALRRVLPRGGLERERLQDGGDFSRSRTHAQGQPGAARADHAGRGRDAREKMATSSRPVVASRHASGTEDLGAGKAIRADVPLAEMFQYSTHLRSLTQGRATYTMEFSTTPRRPSRSPKRDQQADRKDDKARK